MSSTILLLRHKIAPFAPPSSSEGVALEIILVLVHERGRRQHGRRSPQKVRKQELSGGDVLIH